MNIRSLIFSGIILICFSTSTMASENSDNKEPYIGLVLNSLVIICKSDQVVSAGFWRKGDKVIKKATINKDTNPTTWRITFKNKMAEVIRFSGLTQTLEESELYSLEKTIQGLLLISKRESEGISPQIFTIDPSNSSFVYSSQHVNNLWNRANVFYGSCTPYL